MEVYGGQQPEDPFRCSNSPKDIVDRLVEPVSGTKRNITCDNWYTGIDLFRILLQKLKLTAVGTIRKNQADIPPEFLETRNKERYSSMFGFQKDFTLVSYFPKPGKVTLLLSFLHPDNTVHDTEKMLREVIASYNFSKCGVDLVDQMSSSYNVARDSRPLTIFFSLINIASINNQIIFKENNNGKNISRRLFIKELGMLLVKENKCKEWEIQDSHVNCAPTFVQF
ncbi:Transposase IS4 [Popillia japonica]|uniref:Transposase IS4 n=1 Tax=Popillia japonica TaxID=7064 RepID=A0AAW1KGH3_POPJA